jgi:hypothetical protein
MNREYYGITTLYGVGGHGAYDNKIIETTQV